MDIYQEVFINERKDDFNKIDYASWFQGRYFMEAVNSCFNKKAKYPTQPYSYKNLEQDGNVSNELRAEIAAKKFEAFAEVFNKKFENKNK